MSIDYRDANQQASDGNSSQAISSFRWTGNLDPNTPQEFAMVMGIPNLDVSQSNITLYFPTTQTWYVSIILFIDWNKRVCNMTLAVSALKAFF